MSGQWLLAQLEERDEYTGEGVFWVPPEVKGARTSIRALSWQFAPDRSLARVGACRTATSS